MLKKMMLLAVAAAAIAAFVVPASASADVWTNGGAVLEGEETANQSYEGVLTFNAGEAVGTFGCQVTVEIEASAGSLGAITKFNPTTSTCSGTKAFSGCVLKKDTSSIASGWHISIVSTPFTVTASSGNLTIHNEYEGCAGGQTTTHLEFKSVTATPEVVGGIIQKITISGFATNGVFASGVLTAEGTATLGVK
jgi:hypothetical protein